VRAAALGAVLALAACTSSSTVTVGPASTAQTTVPSTRPTLFPPGSTILAPGSTAVVPASTGPPPSTPADYRTIDASKEGFTIAVPSAWRTIDLTKPDVAAQLRTIASKLPANLSSYVDTFIGLASRGGVLLAVDPASAANGFLNNMNVVHTGTATSLAGAEPALRKQYESLGATDIVFTKTSVDQHDALAVSYRLTLATQSVEGLQYVIVGEPQIYFVTFTTKDLAANRRTYEEVIATMQLT
jgi:hypothetical protein